MRRTASSTAAVLWAALTLASATPAHAVTPVYDLTFARVGAVGAPEDCLCIVPADVLWTARSSRPARLRPLRACGGRRRTCAAREHSWSPDGRRLAFGIRRPYKTDIILIRLLDRRRGVVRGDSSDRRLFWLSNPTWSPDGRRLAVTGARSIQDGSDTTVTAIYVIDVRGGRIRRLTDGPLDDGADWSRRGEIAFQRMGARHDPDDVDVFAVRPDGSRLRRMTFGGGFEPDWSPDGRRLAFVRGVGTGDDVFTVKASGGVPRRVTMSGWATGPAWSPDGRLIAYEEGGAIRVVRPGGGTPRTIARPGYEHSFEAPAWRPVKRPPRK